jgi:antitoxin (DNA-binding transcriptional repressor) of toxin-antitoxin stability system
MKTLELKENQVVYDAETRQALTWRDPIILTQNGKRVAALLPIEEYDEYAMWRQAQQPGIDIDWSEDRTIEDVVADIKRRGPGIPNFREATASLKELLENSPHDPDFNLEEWTRDWAKVEAEMKAMEEEDEIKTLAEIKAGLDYKP